MSKFTITVGVMLLLSGSFAPFVLSGSQSQSSISDLTESFSFQGGFQQIEKHISFSAPEIKEDGYFTTIVIPESTSYMMDAGKPMLPYYTQTITFPVGTEVVDVSFTFSTVKNTNINQKVMPAPQPVPLDMDYENYCFNPEVDKDVYFSFAPYPNTWSDYNIGRGLDRGERVIFLSLSFFPVRYTPGLDSLQYVENVDIVVKYKPKPPDSGLTTNDSYDLVIITPQEFCDALQPLVDHKINNMGISTKIVKTDEIYYWDYFQVEGRDRAEQIKYFIKNAYDQWNTKYILLVGGKKSYSSTDEWWIPVRRINIELSSGIYNSISDLYYADLYNGNGTFCSWDSNHNDLFGEGEEDNVDLYPDVCLGRLPCVDLNEVITMVNKIIKYETQSQSAWFNRMILCGGDTHPTAAETSFSSNEGEYIEQEIINVMEAAYPEKSFIGIKLWMSLKSLTASNIIKEIDHGAGFIYFSGHGEETIWGTYSKSNPTVFSFSNKDIDKLGDNNGGYPIAIIHACYCGDFSYTQPCFAWKLIKHQNGGVIAGCASTDVSWTHITSPPTTSLGGLLELCTFKSYVNGGQTFGEMWGGSINLYIDKRMGKYFENLEYCLLGEWQPFGDPSLRLRNLGDSAPENNNPPFEPDKPSGNSSGKAGIQLTFNSLATDPDGDDIYYLFDWSDGTDSGYLGPYNSGETAQATHAWTKDGVFQVKVESLDMHGFESPWSESFDVSISYWNNKVWLFGNIADKEEINGSIHFYTNCFIPFPKLIYIDFIPFEVRKYGSNVLFSVESQNHGFITFQAIQAVKLVFGRFNLQFIVE
jgi:hypothetical protein